MDISAPQPDWTTFLMLVGAVILGKATYTLIKVAIRRAARKGR